MTSGSKHIKQIWGAGWGGGGAGEGLDGGEKIRAGKEMKERERANGRIGRLQAARAVFTEKKLNLVLQKVCGSDVGVAYDVNLLQVRCKHKSIRVQVKDQQR